MKLFVATSYSSQVNYDTGEVFSEYKLWLEAILASLETASHDVFCALRADQYRINHADPAAAFTLDMERIQHSEGLVALLQSTPSSGVQTEIGAAVALGKRVYLAHLPEDKLSYFNLAMVKAGVARELFLPLTPEQLSSINN